MIDVAELMDDPDFASEFQIKRHVGAFAEEGEFSTAETLLDRVGVVQPAKADDVVRYLPEGERQGNHIAIWCAEDVLMANGSDRESDVVVWDGEYYRVAFSKQWKLHGYWFAIATGFVNG